MTPPESPCLTCSVGGDCCHLNEVPVTEADVARLEAHTSLPRKAFSTVGQGWLLLATGPDGSCGFFRAGRCSVHEARPEACRLYPFVAAETPHADGRLRVVRDRVCCPHAGEFEPPRDVAGRLERLLATLDAERATRLPQGLRSGLDRGRAAAQVRT